MGLNPFEVSDCLNTTPYLWYLSLFSHHRFGGLIVKSEKSLVRQAYINHHIYKYQTLFLRDTPVVELSTVTSVEVHKGTPGAKLIRSSRQLSVTACTANQRRDRYSLVMFCIYSVFHCSHRMVVCVFFLILLTIQTPFQYSYRNYVRGSMCI